MFIGFEVDNIISTPLEHLTSIDEVRDRKPIQEIIDLIKEIKQAGHHIVIYTKRDASLGPETEMWLSKHKVPYDRIMFNRPVTPVLFFSNESRQFHNYQTTKEELIKHGVLQAPKETTHSKTTDTREANDNQITKDSQVMVEKSDGTSGTESKEGPTGVQVLK